MNTPAGRRVPTRRRVLAALAIGSVTVACGEVAPAPFAVQLRPYWEPALEVATGSLDVLRTLSINTGAFARGSLTTDQFLHSIELQLQPIADLAQQVIPLGPAPRHAGDARGACSGGRRLGRDRPDRSRLSRQ